jgi:uncharacterized DUF497 family protein
MSEFEWDAAKRDANLRKHGIDLIRGAELFDGRPTSEREARSLAEERLQTTGLIDGRLRTLIWTWRGETRRFISLRSARDEEKRQYRQLHERGN